MNKYYQSYILSNGLRIVYKPSTSNVSYCGFFVNAGTRDEDSDEYGMAHFVEHMLFKGTDKRRSRHIINRMENVGGELNAYTNKEETVIYSVFLEEHLQRATELLTDLVFHSQFPEKEIIKEIDVVIDEIHSYEDSPSELIFDDFENLLFNNSQLGHNILGTVDTLESFTTEKVRTFVKSHYLPASIVFFFNGKTDLKRVIYLVEKYCGDICPISSDYRRIQVPNISEPINEVISKKTSQVHALIGGRSYSLQDPKRKVLHLLNNILGGPGMNSRLNLELREKRGYVYNVESSATAYSDTGMFSIYFGSDKKHSDHCIDLIYKELKNLREKKLTFSQINAAKKQLIGQIGVASDNNEYMSLSLGKTFFHYNHINSPDETYHKINAITAEQLLEVANDIFDEKNLFRLIYH